MAIADMTFEKIVEKTKRMLGENYRGDKEVVPVLSRLVPIEGHTDAFLSVSNGGFTDEEVALIKDKTKNYAWWIANKGYLVDNTQQEIPALFIQGSEIGNIPADVLNINGAIQKNFYIPVNRTNITGEINDSLNHVYVRFILNGDIIEHEDDRNGNGDGLFEINGVSYIFYSGRLYPEDKIIVDNNILYPIYLLSNLDYYYIPTIGEAGEALDGAHDFTPMVKNNLEILEDVCEMVIHEAAQWTNRMVNTLLMNECWPVIVKCACIAYLNRGAEGLDSQTELGQKNTYNDWVTLMHKQIINRRYVI